MIVRERYSCNRAIEISVASPGAVIYPERDCKKCEQCLVEKVQRSCRRGQKSKKKFNEKEFNEPLLNLSRVWDLARENRSFPKGESVSR